MRASNLRIGQILINSGDITEDQLDEVLIKQKTTSGGKRVADILIEDGLVTEQQVCKALEKQLFIPYIDLDSVSIAEELGGIFNHWYSVAVCHFHHQVSCLSSI